MEKAPVSSRPRPATPPLTHHGGSPNWRLGLPTLHASSFVLREVQSGDAESLLAANSTDAVARFISPPPPTAAGLRSYIARTVEARKDGNLVCFAVAPRSSSGAIGLFQIRALSPTFDNAEWGFSLATEYWGAQVFTEAARLVVEFSFFTLGARRLEARVAVRNGRGNGALRKLGAVQEGLLRRSFFRDGEYVDQALWTILAEDWNPDRTLSNLRAH